ncbi:STAS domain-containing protein [Planosporangium flavigriseum]|nr:STAS domain-containing protein [Planosporangium flavigriseum]NJC66087.1 STAS domain-containing protein [Planosporangium flavigriseum]
MGQPPERLGYGQPGGRVPFGELDQPVQTELLAALVAGLGDSVLPPRSSTGGGCPALTSRTTPVPRSNSARTAVANRWSRNLEQLRAAITGILAESGVTDLVVDLESLDFIDSTGVQVLLGAKQTAADRGVGFSANNAQGTVLRILMLLNLHEFLAGPTRT